MTFFKRRKILAAVCVATVLIGTMVAGMFLPRQSIHRGNVHVLSGVLQPEMTEAEVETLLGGAANPNLLEPDPYPIDLPPDAVTKAWGERDCRIDVAFTMEGRVYDWFYTIDDSGSLDMAWRRVRGVFGL